MIVKSVSVEDEQLSELESNLDVSNGDSSTPELDVSNGYSGSGPKFRQV